MNHHHMWVSGKAGHGRRGHGHGYGHRHGHGCRHGLETSALTYIERVVTSVCVKNAEALLREEAATRGVFSDMKYTQKKRGKRLKSVVFLFKLYTGIK